MMYWWGEGDKMQCLQFHSLLGSQDPVITTHQPPCDWVFWEGSHDPECVLTCWEQHCGKLPELLLISAKSSTAIWHERYGCCLFFVCPFLPPSQFFSFLSLSSFCLIWAWHSERRRTPFHSAAVIPWPARQGKAVPCATWQELPGVGGADNSHFHCLFSTVMKLQVSVTEAALSVCALLFFLLLRVFFLQKLGLDSRTSSRLSYLFFWRRVSVTTFNTIQRLSL